MNGHLLDYVKLIDAIDTMLFVITPDGNILACNSAVTRRLGYQRDQLVGKNVNSIHPAGSMDEVTKVLQVLNGCDETVCYLPLVDINGRYIEVETRIYKGTWEGDPVLFGLSTDITEQRMTERKCEAVFQYSPIPILVSRVSDGLIIDANGAWQMVTGYAKDEVIGKTTKSLHLWSNPDERDRLVALLDDRSDFYNEPVTLRTKHWDEVYGLLSGAQLTLDGEHIWITSLIDHTEQHLLEQQLDEIRQLAITSALDQLDKQMKKNKYIRV